MMTRLEFCQQTGMAESGGYMPRDAQIFHPFLENLVRASLKKDALDIFTLVHRIPLSLYFAEIIKHNGVLSISYIPITDVKLTRSKSSGGLDTLHLKEMTTGLSLFKICDSTYLTHWFLVSNKLY